MWCGGRLVGVLVRGEREVMERLKGAEGSSAVRGGRVVIEVEGRKGIEWEEVVEEVREVVGVAGAGVE